MAAVMADAVTDTVSSAKESVCRMCLGPRSEQGSQLLVGTGDVSSGFGCFDTVDGLRCCKHGVGLRDSGFVRRPTAVLWKSYKMSARLAMCDGPDDVVHDASDSRDVAARRCQLCPRTLLLGTW